MDDVATMDGFYTVKEACARLRCRPWALYSGIRRGRYPAIRKPTGGLLIPRREFDALLEAGRVVPESELADA